jgi:hypothetical protein
MDPSLCFKSLINQDSNGQLWENLDLCNEWTKEATDVGTTTLLEIASHIHILRCLNKSESKF